MYGRKYNAQALIDQLHSIQYAVERAGRSADPVDCAPENADPENKVFWNRRKRYRDEQAQIGRIEGHLERLVSEVQSLDARVSRVDPRLDRQIELLTTYARQISFATRLCAAALVFVAIRLVLLR